MRDPGATGELTHSSRWIWWPGLRKMPKNGSPRCRWMISWSAPPGLADAQRAVPLGDRLEVRADQPLHVVADRRRQLGGILDDESRAAVQRAPDAERDREPVAALDPAVARAEQPEGRPVAARQHQVARERHAVPLEQPDGLVARASRARVREQVSRTPFDVRHAAYSNAASCSTSLITRRPSAASMSRGPAFSTEPAGVIRRSSSTMNAGTSIVSAVGVLLPADHPDPAATPGCLRRRGSRRATGSDLAAGRAG